ncbi:excisionase family DNA-binding protein [Nitratidesulfovibrio termitidis]|uniref:excisionase family DNA-binding protein n=1 Tax=Nitratidesulfovibrio termitidis TaxID=42252 RepID=UPI0009FE36F9|nr:excisionase family DNA-binding protein [Nitratidesulfovibrio termitidis]
MFLTVHQAAKRAYRTESAIYKAVRNGKLMAYQTRRHRKISIHQADLDAWIAATKVGRPRKQKNTKPEATTSLKQTEPACNAPSCSPNCCCCSAC